MKRNWTALALALGLTLTLTACGGNPGAAETPGSAAPTGSQTPAAESDLDYVKGNGVLKIGYTLFEPMNYLGEDGELTGAIAHTGDHGIRLAVMFTAAAALGGAAFLGGKKNERRP